MKTKKANVLKIQGMYFQEIMTKNMKLNWITMKILYKPDCQTTYLLITVIQAEQHPLVVLTKIILK